VSFYKGLPLKMEWTLFQNVGNYEHTRTLHNIPEEQWTQPHRNGSLTSRRKFFFNL
jgi:hypothetical protein